MAEIKKIAMVGCGSMGGGMALLFAEKGVEVMLRDPTPGKTDEVLNAAEKAGLKDMLRKHDSDKSLCDSLDNPKVFVWSLPHGNVGDKVLEGLDQYLNKGDIIIDCGNENWQNTQRRQSQCSPKGVRYIGCGVSGGYQAARRGPSMCPGASEDDLKHVMPLLEKVAAKAPDGSPCVGYIGRRGAGHYCKMIHNGIEHGMMAAISEAWYIMHKGLDMSLEEVGDELQRWYESKELKNTFLIGIGADICRKKNDQGNKVLLEVEDKVVQDYTGEEGTGIWSNTEAVDQHVPAPTMTTAHFLRIASGDLDQRRRIKDVYSPRTEDQPSIISVNDRKTFLEDLRRAVYAACLAAYAQGLNIIEKANYNESFEVDYSQLMQIWRNGCIIRSDYINRELLLPLFKDSPKEYANPMCDKTFCKELKETYSNLKKVVMTSIEFNHVVPSLSASLEYVKYMSNTDLPTSFYEAELDYFGSHMYDKIGDDPEGKPTTGKYHFEWKPA